MELRTLGLRRTLPLAALALAASGPPASAQWVEDPGRGWVSAELFYHDTTERYDLNSDKNEIPFGGHAVSAAVFVRSSGRPSDAMPSVATPSQSLIVFSRFEFREVASSAGSVEQRCGIRCPASGLGGASRQLGGYGQVVGGLTPHESRSCGECGPPCIDGASPVGHPRALAAGGECRIAQCVQPA